MVHGSARVGVAIARRRLRVRSLEQKMMRWQRFVILAIFKFVFFNIV
jgi:hypothetical protein